MDLVVVALIFIVVSTFGVYALTLRLLDEQRIRKMVRRYDGGCEHDPHSCWWCRHNLRRPPGA